MKKSIFLLLIVMSSYCAVWGQTAVISRLQKDIVSYEKKDNIAGLVKAEADLCTFIASLDTAGARAHGEKALLWSKKLTSGEYTSYVWSSWCFFYKNERGKFYEQAIDSTFYYAEQSGYPLALAQALYTKGHFSYNDDDLLEAISLFTKHKAAGAPLFSPEEINYKIARSYYLLTNNAEIQGGRNITDLEQYARRLSGMAQRRKDAMTRNARLNVQCMSNLAMGRLLARKYFMVGNRDNIDSAVYYLKNAISVFEKHDDVMLDRNLGGRAALKLAGILLEYYPDMPVDDIMKVLDKAHQLGGGNADRWVVQQFWAMRKELLAKRSVEQAEDTAASPLLYSNRLMVISIVVLACLLLLTNYRISRHRKLLRTKVNEEVLQLKNKQEATLREKEQLQKEALATTVELQQKTEVLQTIRKEISQPDNKLDKLIRESLSADNHFEEYKTQIKEIHPSFYNALQKQAEDKLTDLDLKYCTYIYLSVSSKQIADLLHVEYNTVRMTKYRLKQKLNLDKDDDLYAFIRNLVPEDEPAAS